MPSQKKLFSRPYSPLKFLDCYDDSSSKYNTNGTYINMRCEQPKYKIDSLGKLSILIRTTTDTRTTDTRTTDIWIILKELGRGESMNNVYQSQSCSSLPESQQNQHSTL